MSSSPVRLRLAPDHWFWIGAGVYLLLSFLSFCVVKPATQLYFTDYWEHRAIVTEVIRHGTALTDPIYGEAATSRQFTPWSLGLGWLARATGMGADNALAIGAMLVSLLFVVGMWDFGRAYFRDRWGPALLLAVLCCAWGLQPIMWTGFYSLRSQLHSNYYPASVVFALTFIAWAQVIRLQRAPKVNPVALLLLSLIAACSLITHPLNATPLLGGAIGLLMLEPGVPIRRRAIVLAALVAGVAVTVLWPYFDPLTLGSQGVARGKETFNNFDFFFSPIFILEQSWPALFGLLFARNQWRRPHYRIGVVALAATAAAFVAGRITDVSITHRLLAYVFLAAHLMLTRGLIDIISDDQEAVANAPAISAKLWRPMMIAMGVFTAYQVMLGVDQVVHPWNNSHYDYPLRDVDGETRAFVATLPADARPLGFNSAALVLPTYGIRVVTFPRPMPFSPSDDARQADYRRFFSLGVSTQERRRIAARWGATHLVYLDYEVRRRLKEELALLGPVKAPVGPWRVIVLGKDPVVRTEAIPLSLRTDGVGR